LAPIPNPVHPYVAAAHHSYPIQRTDLEYPTVDVPFLYLQAIGKTEMLPDDARDCYVTVDSFADKALSCLQQVAAVPGDPRGLLMGRRVDRYNFYRTELYAPAYTKDHKIVKYSAGKRVVLAYEAVDLTAEIQQTETFSISGITLKAWRQNVRDLTAPPTLTATDTAFSTGRWGGRNEITFATIMAAQSPSKPALAYFQVPIVGSGTWEDPFGAQMPELLEEHPEFGTVNLLALSHSSLIPSKPDGTPRHKNAIVRIFPQPDRADYLLPIPECLDELRKMPRCKELSREEAIRLALKIDAQLKEEDLEEW